MTASSLASPHDLCTSEADERSFERNRTASLPVKVAEIVENSFTPRDVDWSDLFRYASEHPQIVSVLSEAPTAISKVFGEVRPLLDLVTDPEEDREALFIVIPTTGPTELALRRLRQLDATWFDAAARRANFALNVTVE